MHAHTNEIKYMFCFTKICNNSFLFIPMMYDFVRVKRYEIYFPISYLDPYAVYFLIDTELSLSFTLSILKLF